MFQAGSILFISEHSCFLLEVFELWIISLLKRSLKCPRVHNGSFGASYPTVNSILIPLWSPRHGVFARSELCTKCSETQMLEMAINWVCLYSICSSGRVRALCWLWQGGAFFKLRPCRQSFSFLPVSPPHHCTSSSFSFFFYFRPLSSPLHLSGLELLSTFSAILIVAAAVVVVMVMGG